MANDPDQCGQGRVPPVAPTILDYQNGSDARSPATRGLGRMLVLSIGIQAVLLVFYAASLDGGMGMRLWMSAEIAYWIPTTTVIVRRRQSLTSMDLALIGCGFLPAFLLIGVVGETIASLLL